MIVEKITIISLLFIVSVILGVSGTIISSFNAVTDLKKKPIIDILGLPLELFTTLLIWFTLSIVIILSPDESYPSSQEGYNFKSYLKRTKTTHQYHAGAVPDSIVVPMEDKSFCVTIIPKTNKVITRFNK